MLKDQVKVKDGFLGYLKYIWKENKALYFMGALYFPAFILANYLQIYLPKLVIMELEEKRTVIHLGISILVLILLLMAAIIVKVRMECKVKYGNMVIAQKMENDYAQKLLYVDYECLENRDFITMRNKVYKSLEGTSIGEVHNAAMLCDFLRVLLLVTASLGNAFVYVMYICRLSAWLLVLLLLVPLDAFFIQRVLVKQELRYAEKGSDAWKKMDYTVRRTEDFSMAKDIRLYQMPEWFLGVIRKYIKEGLIYKAKELRVRVLSGGMNTILFGVYNGVVFACILHQFWNGSIKGSDLVFYAGLGPALFRLCSHDLISNIYEVSQVSISFDRFQNFINYGKDSGRQKVPVIKKAPEITLEHVSFAYPNAEEEVLQDLNITIREGEKIAIVGVNGAGKTTLMKLICGLLHPTKGRILINGQDMEEMEAEERYAHFSCVFQDIQFLPLTIRENISMSEEDKSMDEKIWKCLEQAGMKKEIEQLPDCLDTWMEKNINKDAVDFSGGQRQKLILARALYRDAGALILDEPTAALDALAENEIYERYAEFAGSKTSFFVSHRLSSTRFCDRILLIDGGKVAEEGRHAELLLAEGLYAKMFDMQSKYYQEGVE